MRALIAKGLLGARRFIVRCRDTLWLNTRLGYPMGEAWRRAGWWAM